MNKCGQSLIEYVLIAVLVILGTVLMGPYVLRSVNAYFKLWDGSVQDSFEENIKQAQVNNVPDIPLDCHCTNTVGSCGSQLPGSNCPPNERENDHNCNPQGCDYAPANSCTPDPSCCSQLMFRGCGTIPIGQPSTSTNCNYGQAIMGKQCGSDFNIQCTPNPTCDPACLGILESVNGVPTATPCPGATTELDQNYGITYAASQQTCSGQKCQYYCNSGQTNSNGIGCAPACYLVPTDLNSLGPDCSQYLSPLICKGGQCPQDNKYWACKNNGDVSPYYQNGVPATDLENCETVASIEQRITQNNQNPGYQDRCTCNVSRDYYALGSHCTDYNPGPFATGPNVLGIIDTPQNAVSQGLFGQNYVWWQKVDCVQKPNGTEGYWTAWYVFCTNLPPTPTDLCLGHIMPGASLCPNNPSPTVPTDDQISLTGCDGITPCQSTCGNNVPPTTTEPS